MTLGQVEALCAGIAEVERRDLLRMVTAHRLAVHGSDDDVDDFFEAASGRDYDAEMDAILAKYQGDQGG